MLRKRKLLFLVLPIILIPILLGMTPLNLISKFSSGWPLSQGRQTLRGDFCLFNSLISQDDLTIGILNSTVFVQDSALSLHFQTWILDPSDCSSHLNSVPLRC
jgi:hypothetical protein